MIALSFSPMNFEVVLRGKIYKVHLLNKGKFVLGMEPLSNVQEFPGPLQLLWVNGDIVLKDANTAQDIQYWGYPVTLVVLGGNPELNLVMIREPCGAGKHTQLRCKKNIHPNHCLTSRSLGKSIFNTLY